MKKRLLTSLLLCFVLIVSTFSFVGCGSAEGYTLSEDGTYYTFTGLTQYESTEYTILSEVKGVPVTEIAKSAFEQNMTLTKVTIPNSITTMGSSAFNKCGELKEVVIGTGLKIIPESAFANSIKLTTVTFSEGLEEIGRNAFNNCLKLDNVVLPSTVTTLASKAFYKCRRLSSIVLPENLTKLETSCFEECSGLLEVTINKNLTEISVSCFKKCPKIATINFAMDGKLEMIENSAFNGSAVSELVFPDSLKCIKAGAFFNCKQLRKVTFGKGIEFIGGAVSDTAGGAFSEYVAPEDKATDTTHVLEMIFPEEAIGYGWYPTLDPYGSNPGRVYWREGNPGSHDLYFLTPEEIKNNEAREQLAQSMGGYSWAKCKTPNPDYAV